MIIENIEAVRNQLPEGVRLVAVSKYHPESDILEAYEDGQRIFGENIVQELVGKQAHLPADIEWHFIGHLQTNKVKYIAPFVSLIHSVDSERLLHEIDKQAQRNGRVIPCLVQVHVAAEETKFGFTPDELLDFFASETWRQYKNVEIRGIMAMATNTDDEARIRQDFRTCTNLFQRIKAEYFPSDDCFCERSMGMSDDYQIAIEEGSTLVRVGSRIFGERGKAPSDPSTASPRSAELRAEADPS